MKNEEILKKAIDKATDNGWVGKIQYLINPELHCANIIFSHDFAKAFWGFQAYCPVSKEFMRHRASENEVASWQYHLQKMVLEEDPIKYLEKFI